MTNLFNQESNDHYKSRCLSQPPNYYSSKPWFLLFKGLKSAEKIYLTLFAFNDYLPQLTPTLATKGIWFAAEKTTREAKEKTRAYIGIFNLFSIKELYLINCHILCIGLGWLVEGPTIQVRLKSNKYIGTHTVVGSTRRLYDEKIICVVNQPNKRKGSKSYRWGTPVDRGSRRG